MIHYYSPHFHLSDLKKTIWCDKAETGLIDYFRKKTGKEYVLITSSCRTALFLAYKAIGSVGLVHTSPLTCKVALMPIISSGNQICFQDVKEDDWTLDPESINQCITKDSIAIQAVHFGGFSCDMSSLRRIADESNLVLVEDCAQGFGATYHGVQTGILGDISCFTLSKNLFGLGGGVFVTNNAKWYNRARSIQDSYINESSLRIIYRIAIPLLYSSYDNLWSEMMYFILKSSVGVFRRIVQEEDLLEVDKRKPPLLYSKSVYSRLDKIAELNLLRRSLALYLIENIGKNMIGYQTIKGSFSSYTKLFLYSSSDSRNVIRYLNNNGIEAMHLEHKKNIHYQEKLTRYHYSQKNLPELPVYNSLHDRIFSIPLIEGQSSSRTQQIVSQVREAIKT